MIVLVVDMSTGCGSGGRGCSEVGTLYAMDDRGGQWH